MFVLFRRIAKKINVTKTNEVGLKRKTRIRNTNEKKGRKRRAKTTKKKKTK